ncbi:hypothetical protein HZA44_01010 [Candidatus Peregrinibacteria bacterium]|nr:hypothetical protein [Candidatus Peregrinibacteria bacterium]
MGIVVEFNPDLALRNVAEFSAGRRRIEECIPEPLEVGKEYPFLKKGQRNYWLFGELPLLETKGDQHLSRPLASIIILEAVHFREGDSVYTKGRYRVVEVFKDGKSHFDGFAKIN